MNESIFDAQEEMEGKSSADDRAKQKRITRKQANKKYQGKLCKIPSGSIEHVGGKRCGYWEIHR